MKRPPTGLGKKIEIEPLSETRWTRVERVVFDAHAANLAAGRVRPQSVRPDALHPRWRLAAALLVLAGAVATIAGGLAWRAVDQQASLFGHDARDAHDATRVETAANGSRVEFGESTIDVGPTSAVRLAGNDAQGVVVTLDRGRVECDVAPRRERPPFLVEAGGVEVRVIGTHFVVARTGDAVSVEVQRGEVEVTSAGERALVPAGSRWPLAPSTPASVGAASGPAPVASDTAPEPIARDPGARGPVEHGAAGARSAAVSSPHEQYDGASRLEASQPATAIALYRDLARQGGAWGANALFAEGRLEADRGDQDAARRVLRDYLSRYPGGPNANDARQLLDRLR